MSKGLGKIQRDILDTLDAAKQTEHRYEGSGCHYNTESGWVVIHNQNVKIAPEIYDLRQSMRHLAKKYGSTCSTSVSNSSPTEEFRAAFSRAVRSLIRRGLLEKVKDLPITEYYREYPKKHSGKYERDTSIWVYSKQTRFVKRL